MANGHGGARANSGGARPGAGRPRKKPVLLDTPATGDPLVFLRLVMANEQASPKIRIEAAKALLPYVHMKLGEAGLKNQKQVAAKKAGAGRFAQVVAPTLVEK